MNTFLKNATAIIESSTAILKAYNDAEAARVKAPVWWCRFCQVWNDKPTRTCRCCARTKLEVTGHP